MALARRAAHSSLWRRPRSKLRHCMLYDNRCRGTELPGALDREFHGDDEAISFVVLLRTCTKNKDLCQGSRIHDDVLRRGLLAKCSDALVTMYAKCAALDKAKALFDMHKTRDVFTWTALIAGYAHTGQDQIALDHFEWMQRQGLSPDAVTYSCILKACASLREIEKGERIHDELAKKGLLSNNIVLGNALVNMYAKCGALDKARSVLEEIQGRDAISWNALIAGYVEHGQVDQALVCYERMQDEGLSPHSGTHACILKACGISRAAVKGAQIHNEIAEAGLLKNNLLLSTAVVDMYAKCGALAKAQQVLDELKGRDVIAWNALIGGYVEHGKYKQSFKLFEQMRGEGLSPDVVTYVCILKACANTRAVEKGKKIHDMILEKGPLKNNVILGTALVDMYAKCGALRKARRVLEDLHIRNVVTWNTLIAAYVDQGEGSQALNCFEQMQCEGLSPDALTFLHVLKACGSIGATRTGEKIHHCIFKQGLLEENFMLSTALVDMYSKCGALSKARRVLQELPILDASAGYAHNEGEKGITFHEDFKLEGLSSTELALIWILKACGSVGAVDKGEEIHNSIIKKGLFGHNVVLGTALVDMYAKCGTLTKAQGVLEELHVWDAVPWTALITGYAEHGEGAQAVACFERMQHEGLSPDTVTFVCILKACGSIGAAEKGARIHDEILKQGLLGNDVVLGISLVDMYAKCGALARARQVLEELPVRDVISWTALIAGHVQQCEIEQALNCFEQMQHEGLIPDAATLSCVLSACSRLGLIEYAQTHFVNMATKFGMNPDLLHYASMVDVFGRAGLLDRAIRVIDQMPSATSAVWSASLLGACQKWGDVEVGKWAFQHTVKPP